MSTHQPRRESDPHGSHRRPPPAGGNPLRRTSDRVQSWLARLLFVLLVLGLPAVSVSTGLASYRSEMSAVRAETAARTAVAARLVNDAATGTRVVGEGDTPKVPAPVRWTDPGGTARVDTARVDAGTKAGATVRVWVDRKGEIVPAPRTSDQAAASGWLTATMTAGAALALSLAAWKGFTHLLDRRRYTQWEAEWGRVEPLWSRRFRR